jgi:hypothetical protein
MVPALPVGLTPMLLISLLVALLAVEDGITADLYLHSTRMPTVTQDLVVVVEPALLVAPVMASGEMVNILLDQPMHVLSVSSSVSSTIQPSNKQVSTLRNTMISPSRHPVRMSLNQSSNSATLLSMTILSETSSSPTTKFPPRCKSILFLSSWVAVT